MISSNNYNVKLIKQITANNKINYRKLNYRMNYTLSITARNT